MQGLKQKILRFACCLPSSMRSGLHRELLLHPARRKRRTRCLRRGFHWLLVPSPTEGFEGTALSVLARDAEQAAGYFRRLYRTTRAQHLEQVKSADASQVNRLNT